VSGLLRFLGKRRPSSLEDQGSYDEQVSRPAAKPVKHALPDTQLGHHLGERGAERRAAPGVGRHRRDK
jgi:hypothetical protein